MSDRRLAAVWLISIAVLAGVMMARTVQGTTAYFTDSHAGSINATLAKFVPCPLADFGYDATGAQPYPLLVVHVWAKTTLPANCALAFSLNSYTTQGPDWPSTGTQALLDHETITLNASHSTGTLTVQKPLCYGQTDFYTGSIRFDGVDGALPHYPDTVVPQPLLAWSNGPSTKPKGCKQSMLMSGPLDSSAPGDPSSPAPSPSSDPSASPDPAASAPTDPPVLAPQPPVVDQPPVLIPPPSPDPTASPDPTEAPSPSPAESANPDPPDAPAASDAPAPTDPATPPAADPVSPDPTDAPPPAGG
jgi:hypothetical protein